MEASPTSLISHHSSSTPDLSAQSAETRAMSRRDRETAEKQRPERAGGPGPHLAAGSPRPSYPPISPRASVLPPLTPSDLGSHHRQTLLCPQPSSQPLAPASRRPPSLTLTLTLPVSHPPRPSLALPDSLPSPIDTNKNFSTTHSNRFGSGVSCHRDRRATGGPCWATCRQWAPR